MATSFEPQPSIFVVENSRGGDKPIRYSCEQLMEYNEAYPLKVEFYYDLMHDVQAETSEILETAQAALLKAVAKHFGLIDGARCSIPPVTALWLINIDSDDRDEPAREFNSCLELEPGDGQACTVIKGTMVAHYLGAGDPSSFEKFIQQNLNTVGKQYEDFNIAYLGATLDTSRLSAYAAKDNLAPSLNRAEAPPTQSQGKRTFTFVGGLVVAGFLAAFLGFFLVLYRRRQSFLAAQDLEIALSKSDMDDIAPRDNDDACVVRPQSFVPEIGKDGDVEQHEDELSSSNYRFDLATSMKNELFNIHGRAADPPKAYGIGIEETSDSDADSWAQTDGTIGSLELQLEPITAEV